ncbi:hypothetical protein MASR1M60_01950 [Rhodocyclaceae bacterium]
MSTPANRTQALTQTILQHYAAGDYSQVEAIARELVSLSPEDGFAWKALGTALCSQNRFDEAVPALQQAVQRMPNNAEAWSNLAQALKILGRLEESIGALQNALRRAPQDANLYNLLGGTLADYGQLDQAFASYRRALELDPYNLAAFSNMLLGYQYHPASDPAFVKAEALRFGETVRRMATPYTDWPNTPDPQRPLNIGLVSADFGSHPVGRFLQGILGRLDQTRYRIVAYSNRNDVEDAITRHIRRKVFLWRAVWGKVDAEVAALIRADQIDILVDLAGHTGGNRLSLFAWKPAPVQVTWLGFFATTGVAEIDYILADRCVLPEDETNHFVEAPWYLPDAYYCYTRPGILVPVNPLPALQNGYVTFGCFNNLTKVSDAVIACWGRILSAVPTARLFLKTSQLKDAKFCARLQQRLAAHGIGAERVMLEPSSDRKTYLEAYHRVDIALDPFPFPGGATTVEGLWMGVPVVTLRGNRFIAHQGETILQAAGLPEWIAADQDEYVAKAVQFAGQLEALAALRARLRPDVALSPIFDTRRFASNLETAFRGMWTAWVEHLNPIVVS